MVLRKRTAPPPDTSAQAKPKAARKAIDATDESGGDPVGLSGMNAPVLAEMERCRQALKQTVPSIKEPLEKERAFNKAAFKRHQATYGVYTFNDSILCINLSVVQQDRHESVGLSLTGF